MTPFYVRASTRACVPERTRCTLHVFKGEGRTYAGIAYEWNRQTRQRTTRQPHNGLEGAAAGGKI